MIGTDNDNFTHRAIPTLILIYRLIITSRVNVYNIFVHKTEKYYISYQFDRTFHE
ncbi:hypothetical protein ANG_1069 [Streptococcus anginosus subsp. whileyi MAS624]|nr:hypothetical protein ANG_1069 [Streptococcus anginosus subsp. whileyi MAS624]